MGGFFFFALLAGERAKWSLVCVVVVVGDLDGGGPGEGDLGVKEEICEVG